MTEVTITPESADWPEFAPAWATSAAFELGACIFTFERGWSIPGLYRDMEPLTVVRALQEFIYNPSEGVAHPGETWVGTGPQMLWADHRREKIATTLRAIADVLVPEQKTTGAK